MNYDKLENNFNYKFTDQSILQTALTHRSFLNETREDIEHNERLEFLGDAVLELATTEFLFSRFPDAAEGEMTSYRAAMVRTESISAVAETLGVNEYLRLSRGEQQSVGKARHDILANTFEAILGAIYLDGGYPAADQFLQKHLFPSIDSILNNASWRDAKSYVQEKAQELFGTTPHYDTISEHGPDHDREFHVAIYFGEKKIADGRGRSKKSAETNAAKNALELQGWE